MLTALQCSLTPLQKQHIQVCGFQLCEWLSNLRQNITYQSDHFVEIFVIESESVADGVCCRLITLNSCDERVTCKYMNNIVIGEHILDDHVDQWALESQH